MDKNWRMLAISKLFRFYYFKYRGIFYKFLLSKNGTTITNIGITDQSKSEMGDKKLFDEDFEIEIVQKYCTCTTNTCTAQYHIHKYVVKYNVSSSSESQHKRRRQV